MDKRVCLGLTLIIFCFTSCSYSYQVETTPRGALIRAEGQKINPGELYKSRNNRIKLAVREEGYYPYDTVVEHRGYFGTSRVTVVLEKKRFKISLNTIDLTCDVFIQKRKAGTTPCTVELEYGTNYLVLKKGEKKSQEIRLFCSADAEYLFRFQEKNTGTAGLALYPIGVFSCGSQPKQVHFSPDDGYITIPLLNGLGFQLFDMEKRSVTSYFQPETYAKQKGFVEGLFIAQKKVFLVSQMTTGRLFEYKTSGGMGQKLQFSRQFSTGGNWSKVIAWSQKHQILAVSNWLSGNVTILEYTSGKVIKKIKGLNVPRGLAFDSEGKYLFIAEFGGGRVLKYAVDGWKLSKSLYKRGAAMRHLVLSEDNKTCYVSNMAHNEVYSITADSLKITHTYKVPLNPNTIALMPGKELLFVSTRGPNNPAGYLEKSPAPGEVVVLDLKQKKQILSLEGGRQPTGLDVSSNGKYLAFSNFQDDTIEIYEIITN